MVSRNKRWMSFFIMWLLLVICMSIASGETGQPYFPITGYTLLKEGPVTVDISNAESGYILVKHSGTSKRLKLTVTHLLGQNRYDLKGDGKYETIPLTHGSGPYWIGVYEQQKNAAPDTYQRIFGSLLDVEMPDRNTAFLYPNQYVSYTEYSWAVSKSNELCRGLISDIDKVESIFTYIRKQIRYDYVKSVTTHSSYLPNVDETLKEGTGICVDYAALLACMLRVQGIPTQLVVGKLLATNPPQNHAWNKVFIGGNWLMLDPTYGASRFTQAQYIEQHTY